MLFCGLLASIGSLLDSLTPNKQNPTHVTSLNLKTRHLTFLLIVMGVGFFFREGRETGTETRRVHEWQRRSRAEEECVCVCVSV